MSIGLCPMEEKFMFAKMYAKYLRTLYLFNKESSIDDIIRYMIVYYERARNGKN